MTKEEFELLVQPGDYIRVQAGQETMEGTVKAVLSSSVLLLRRDGGRSVVEIASVSGLELVREQPQNAPEAQPEPRNDVHSEPQPQQPAMPPAEECGQLAARAAAQGDFDRAEQLYQQALEQDRSAETLTRVFQTVYLSRKGTPEEQVARARRGLELLERRGDVLPEAARVNFRIHLLDDAGETQRYKEELEKAMPVVPQKQRVAYMNLLGKQLFGEGDYAGAARYFQMWRDTWLQERQTEKADACVRALIWERIEDNPEDLPYFDTFTEEDLARIFYPEEDFYLDENGNPVFYLQPGFAMEGGGLTEIPITLEEILDEM